MNAKMIGTTISALRRKCGLTQAELAEKTARLNELNNLLDLENGKAEDIDLAGQEEEPEMAAEERQYRAGMPQRNRR